MSISPQKYVNIVSGVGASANVPTRDLIGRFFTGSSLVPPKTFVQFTTAAQVISFFGASSEEAQRAIFYFSFISKTLVQPAAIQFARWTQTAVAPMIQSPSNNNSILSNWTSINNGSFGITMAPITDGVVGTPVIGTFTGISFVSATDLTDVANILTQAVQSDFIINLVGSLASGSTAVTGLSSTASLVTGMHVVGTGIPADTVISSITNGTSIVISNAAQGTVQTGVLTNTDTTVTGLQDTSILAIGMEVTGTGIPSSTTIASITDSTTIELSLAATVTGSESLTFMAATTAIEFFTPTNSIFADSTVVSSNGGFIFTGGVTGDYAIELQGNLGGTDLTPSPLLGWLPQATFVNGVYTGGSLVSNGSVAQTITECLTDSVSTSNNFGSFLFLNNLNLSLANAILAATWNQTQNNMFMFCAPVLASNYAAWTNDSTGLGLLGGTALTLSGISVFIPGTLTSSSAVITGLPSTNGLAVGMPVVGTNIPVGSVIIAIAASPSTNVTISNNATGSGSEVIQFIFNQFPEQIPMMIEAATDYAARNSVQNYMFQGPFASLFPSVTNDTDKIKYDSVSVNYYGNTQQAGVPVNFYQVGVLQGASPSPLDMTTYVNEIWLKDAITTQILNLFVSSNQIPANTQGRAQILAGLQSVINQALTNGTISVNKTLSTQQQMFITSQTGDANAWYQVQSIGYWVDCAIVNTAGVYSATYTLIYSKDDVIRLVDGQDILI
jgi:hypothetical protein